MSQTKEDSILATIFVSAVVCLIVSVSNTTWYKVELGTGEVVFTLWKVSINGIDLEKCPKYEIRDECSGLEKARSSMTSCLVFGLMSSALAVYLAFVPNHQLNTSPNNLQVRRSLISFLAFIAFLTAMIGFIVFAQGFDSDKWAFGTEHSYGAGSIFSIITFVMYLLAALFNLKYPVGYATNSSSAPDQYVSQMDVVDPQYQNYAPQNGPPIASAQPQNYAPQKELNAQPYQQPIIHPQAFAPQGGGSNNGGQNYAPQAYQHDPQEQNYVP